MGILASIFAYLSAVAAIIVFVLMSADALLYHPHHHATNPRSELVTAAKIDPHKPKAAAPPPQRPANVAAIPQRSAATEYRRRADLTNTRIAEQRRLALHRAQQARYWALHRGRAAAPRALGFAEEPTPRFGDESWR
jgi:hypothetical protein